MTSQIDARWRNAIQKYSRSPRWRCVYRNQNPQLQLSFVDHVSALVLLFLQWWLLVPKSIAFHSFINNIFRKAHPRLMQYALCNSVHHSDRPQEFFTNGGVRMIIHILLIASIAVVNLLLCEEVIKHNIIDVHEHQFKKYIPKCPISSVKCMQLKESEHSCNECNKSKASNLFCQVGIVFHVVIIWLQIMNARSSLSKTNTYGTELESQPYFRN